MLLLSAPASAAPAASRWIVKVNDVRSVAGLGERTATVSDDTFVVEAAVRPTGPSVVWAVPDTPYQATRVPTDVCFLACPSSLEGQKELRTIRAPEAWDVTTGSPSILVAVLDTPVDITHPDLAGKVVRGPDLIATPCVGPSLVWHGTATSGIVGARTDNGEGIASLGWQTPVLAIAVLDDCGFGSASGVAMGIRHAVDAGARVLNLSLAGPDNPALGEAVAYARQRGVLVVAAAGNDGSTTQVYPAGYPGVLAVGATDTAEIALASFSNRGPWVDVAAPGVNVLSTAPGASYATASGTSFSAPLVAAGAALVLARHPDWNGDDVAVRLVRSARRVGGVDAPMLDVGAAVTERPGGAVLAAADGRAFTFGDVAFHGSAAPLQENRQVVGVGTSGPNGYWLVAGDGAIFPFGDAQFLGGTNRRHLNEPIVGMASTPSHRGYWLVARDGGVFSFGDARFFGSAGAIRLNTPIVGMAATPSGAGYFLVAGTGGVFTFGDARFAGSAGNLPLASPIVGMAASTVSSYWLASADGRVFSFGGAPLLGAADGRGGAPTIGIAAGPGGYWLGTRDGQLLPFGDVPDDGSVHPLPASPVVAIAGTS